MEMRKQMPIPGRIKLEKLRGSESVPYTQFGPLLSDLWSSAASSISEYIHLGGYAIARRAISDMTGDEITSLLDKAGLRGRAGGGYPTAHKWWLVSQSRALEKYFICNANAGQPGGFKEQFLLKLNPHAVLEAIIIGAAAVGAQTAFLVLPPHFALEARLLETALREAREHGYVGGNAFGTGKALEVHVYKSLGGYIAGEETALMELIEGKVGHPRGKPPLPTAVGLFNAPTAVNNLETVLNARYIIKVGPEQYRQHGTPYAPGTMIFSLSGHVNRPGLYELPLGTPLRDLIFKHGQGVVDGLSLKAVLPGGISSAVLGPESLDVELAFDTLHDAGSDLGSGTVIVIAERTCMVDVATHVSRFFRDNSCGKCQPCVDGTGRTVTMLSRLDRLNEKSIDLAERARPSSRRTLTVINAPGGLSYTDTIEGLDKIRHLSEFYKYRGDCHYSTEAATSIQSFLARFTEEFECHRVNSTCDA
jgi:NADH-quinone oxidoreductase subunit F